MNLGEEVIIMPHYKYGIVATRSGKWVQEIINGHNKGISVFDFWTNGWTIGKGNLIDELHVFYRGSFVVRGNFLGQYKDTPTNIFQSRYVDKEQFGANPADTLRDFETQYRAAFVSAPKSKFGNLEFEILDIVRSVDSRLTLCNYSKNQDVHDFVNGNLMGRIIYAD